ncbi:MAG: hypothetical protein IJR31_06180 [Lachnospiraceae bacterium]|nr:hypothetical protein [Lachnospiraceae bacterium]
MDNPIMLTPHDVWNIVMAVCGGIVAISAAVVVILKVIDHFKAPDKKQDERIKTLEKEVEEINIRLRAGDSRFESDTQRVGKLESKMNKTNKIIIESLQVLIEHDIDGNNNDGLKQMKHKLDAYLLEQTTGE